MEQVSAGWIHVETMEHLFYITSSATSSLQKRVKTPTREFNWSGPCRRFLFKDSLQKTALQSKTTRTLIEFFWMVNIEVGQVPDFARGTC